MERNLLTKEELLNIKILLASLSQEEKMLRDLALRDSQVKGIELPIIGENPTKEEIQMVLKGEALTNYPSLDKTWLKHHDLEEYFESKKEEMATIYQEIINSNKNNPDAIALEFFGRKITFKELEEKTEEAAKALVKSGVQEKDIVTIIATGTPETLYTLMAISKLGATANLIPPYFDKEQMVQRINETNSKLAIVMDVFYADVAETIKKTQIEKTVYMPTLQSVPFLNHVKVLQKMVQTFVKERRILKRPTNGEDIISWHQFIEEGKTIKSTPTVEAKDDHIFALVYSSGTTGASKSIALTNSGTIKTIRSYDQVGLKIEPFNKFYQLIPFWFSTGFVVSLFLPLSKKCSVFMDPRFEKKTFAKNVITKGINYILAPTTMLLALTEEYAEKLLEKQEKTLAKKGKKGALAGVKHIFDGGEPLAEKFANEIERVLKKYGSKTPVKVGYGQCEGGASMATQTSHVERAPGAVGIPLPGINVQVTDEEGYELPFGKRGILRVQTPTRMAGYFKNPTETAKYFDTSIPDDEPWSITGDIAEITDEGQLRVYGRASDYTLVGTEENNELIYNFDVEALLLETEYILGTEVLGYENENGETELRAHIVLEEEYQNLSKEQQLILLEIIKMELMGKTNNPNLIPTVFKIRDELPHARSGKLDSQALKAEKDGYIRIPETIEENLTKNYINKVLKLNR